MAGKKEEKDHTTGKKVGFTIFEDVDSTTNDDPPRGRSMLPRASQQNFIRPRPQTPPNKGLFPRFPDVVSNTVQSPPTTRTMFPRRQQVSPPPPQRHPYVPPHLRSPQPFKPVVMLPKGCLTDPKFLKELEEYDKERAKLAPKNVEEALARLNAEAERKWKEKMAAKDKENKFYNNAGNKSSSNDSTGMKYESNMEENMALARKLQEEEDALIAQKMQDEEHAQANDNFFFNRNRSSKPRFAMNERCFIERERGYIIRLAQGLLRSRTTVPFRRLANFYNRRYAGSDTHKAFEQVIKSSGGGVLAESRRAPWRTASELIELSKNCPQFRKLLTQHSAGYHLGTFADHYSDDEEDQEPGSERDDVVMEDESGMTSPKRKSEDPEGKYTSNKKPRYNI